ncbi:hypothetical protein HKX48_005213 [Thoreauomyces humboldtii]|nr:hypothetical protein HKX48_005213 [Thoreauomyces humboldtii]
MAGPVATSRPGRLRPPRPVDDSAADCPTSGFTPSSPVSPTKTSTLRHIEHCSDSTDAGPAAAPSAEPTRARKPAWNASPALQAKLYRQGTKTVTANARPTSTPAAGGPTVKLPSGRTPIRGNTATSPTTAAAGHDHVTQRYETLLARRNASDSELRETLRTLRRTILQDGLPDPPDATTNLPGRASCTLRGRVWKVLLGIYRVSAGEYLGLVERGPSAVYDKIKNDTFRTLATDRKFLARVDEGMLSRLLNGFVWKMEDAPPSRLLNLTYSYVQGMNVLAAPFLYVMPELDAFYTFTAFVQHACPLYVQPALEGVHCGLKLLDRCLRVCDPVLFRHLKAKGLTAQVYAFPSVMTFSACTPPLDALLRLWDFLLSYGLHLNILCIIAQLLLIRTDLLKSPSPMKLLRTFPELRPRQVIQQTLALVPRLPEDLYDMLVRHPFDAGVYDVVMGDDAEDGL